MFTNIEKKFYGSAMVRQDFYLTKRRLNSGRSIYYFYFYDIYGNRTVPKTTGKARKQDAFEYCLNLVKTHSLTADVLRFKSYAYGFFDEGSPWYQDKMISGGLSDSTIKGYRSYFKYHIYPYFSDMIMSRITPNIIRDFRVFLIEEKELSAKTINNIIDCLRIIFDWAIQDMILQFNPINKTIKPLSVDSVREAFTYDEVKYVLGQKWDDYECWLYVLTASLTGLRFSEVQGLQRSAVHSNYLEINCQYQNNKLTQTKTKEKRFVPIPEKLSKMLLDFCGKNDFVFWSIDNREKPISRTTVVRKFYRYYSEQMKSVKSEKLLTFHSLRHFFNTYLVSKNIQSQKINFIIGHSDGKEIMQRLYTSWQPEMYEDVIELQNNLLANLIM